MGATRNYWFVLTAWRMILVLIFCSWVQNLHAEDWQPRKEHYLASVQGMDCSIYRTLARKAQAQVEENKSLLSGHLELLKQKREELERCGRARGIESVGGKSFDLEQRLAELCPESYDAWLTPGYSAAMVQEDIANAKKDLANAKVVITHRCAYQPF